MHAYRKLYSDPPVPLLPSTFERSFNALNHGTDVLTSCRYAQHPRPCLIPSDISYQRCKPMAFYPHPPSSLQNGTLYSFLASILLYGFKLFIYHPQRERVRVLRALVFTTANKRSNVFKFIHHPRSAQSISKRSNKRHSPQ